MYNLTLHFKARLLPYQGDAVREYFSMLVYYELAKLSGMETENIFVKLWCSLKWIFSLPHGLVLALMFCRDRFQTLTAFCIPPPRFVSV